MSGTTKWVISGEGCEPKNSGRTVFYSTSRHWRLKPTRNVRIFDTEQAAWLYCEKMQSVRVSGQHPLPFDIETRLELPQNQISLGESP
jgi:hypothetical protein